MIAISSCMWYSRLYLPDSWVSVQTHLAHLVSPSMAHWPDREKGNMICRLQKVSQGSAPRSTTRLVGHRIDENESPSKCKQGNEFYHSAPVLDGLVSLPMGG